MTAAAAGAHATDDAMAINGSVLSLLTILWGLWATAAILAAWQTAWFARQINRRRGRYAGYQPRAFVIVPFKGLEKDLPTAIESLCRQRYADYQLLLVVESEDDPAHAVLERELARHADRPARIIVAGAAPSRQGQKLHNQLAALRVIDNESRDDDVWVFADSDAVPGPDWLAELVGPLSRESKYGASTGYRWLTPAPDAASGRVRLWSHLASVMNSSVACLLGRPRLNFAWGGSMAVRAAVARRGGLTRAWTGALTDDYPLSRLCRRLKLRIAFAPACLVATPVNFSFAELVNFAHRQYLLTRVYVPWLYRAALVIAGLYVVALISSIACLLFALRTQAYCIMLLPLGAWAIVFLADQARARHRRRAIVAAFGADMARSLRATLRVDRWLTPLWMTMHFLLMLRAGVGRTMVWRGRRYRLRSPNDIELC